MTTLITIDTLQHAVDVIAVLLAAAAIRRNNCHIQRLEQHVLALHDRLNK